MLWPADSARFAEDIDSARFAEDIDSARFAEDIQTQQTQTNEDNKKQDKGEWKMMKPGQSMRVYRKESSLGLEILKIIDEEDTKFAMALGWPVGRHSDLEGQYGIADIAMKALADGTCENGKLFKTFAKDKGGGGSCTAENSQTVCLMALKQYNPDVTKCFLQNLLKPTNLAGLEQATKIVKVNLKNQKRGWANAAIMDAQAAKTSPQAKVHLGSNQFIDDVVDEDMVYKWLDEHLSIGMARLVVFGNVDVSSLLNDIKPLRWPQDPVTPLPTTWPAAKTAWPAESKGLFMIRHNTDSEKQRTLRLQWIFDGRPDMDNWQTHPSYTLCEVFNSDDEVSLKEFMKSNSLIHGLSCGGIKDPAHWRVQIFITLTESADVDMVLHVVNYYISEVLNTEPAVKELMESLAKRSAMNWEIAEELTGVKAVNGAIAQFIYFPAAWVLKARRTIVKLDEPALFGLISGMKPSNLNIMLDEIDKKRFDDEKAKNHCEKQTLMTADKDYWVGPNSRKEALESWFDTNGIKKNGPPPFLKTYENLPKTPPPVVVPTLSEDDYVPQNTEPRDVGVYADAYYGENPDLLEDEEGAELWIREGWVKSNSISGKLNLALEIMRDPGQERTAAELACLSLYGSVLHEQYSSLFDEQANYPKTHFTWWKGSGGISLTISTLKSLMGPIGEEITKKVLKPDFTSVEQERWNKLLKKKQDNPLGRSTAHPKFDASDIKYLMVRSERYSEVEWLTAYNGLSFQNTEDEVKAYYQKYPMLLTGLAMGSVDEESVTTLFNEFKAMLNAVSAEESGDRKEKAAKTFGSTKKLKQPIEVRHSTAGKDDPNYENNVADVTLISGIQSVVERVLDQQISQYMTAWVKDYKEIIDAHYTDEFVFATALGSFGNAVRTWTSSVFSTEIQVDVLELLIEVFHLQVVPRLIASLDTVDLVTKMEQWLQGVLVKKLPQSQLDHFQYHLDNPQGSWCFDRLNQMSDAFAELKQHPEKTKEMMMDRWLTLAMSPQRKRLVVKVSKNLPGSSGRKSPETSSTLFAQMYKNHELKKVTNQAFTNAMAGLNQVFSGGTFIITSSITEPIHSVIRKTDVIYEEDDYPVEEECFLEDGWDEYLEEEEMEEEEEE